MTDSHGTPAGDPRDDSEAIRRETTHTQELVRRYQEGEAPALDEILERYYPRLHRIVRIRLGPKIRRRMDSMDIVQEVFGDALLGFDRFEMREPASMVRWLATIAENRIRGAAKRVSAAKQDPSREVSADRLSGDRSQGLELEGGQTQPAEALLRAERENLVDECVAGLKEEWRAVLLLRDYEGGSWAHVSAQLERSEPAAQMLHKRAKEALQEALEERGFRADP